MPYKPLDKLEDHFYRLLKNLPRNTVYEALPLSEKEIDRIVQYAHSRKGRRPVNRRKILDLRHSLLDRLDASSDKYLDLLLEQPHDGNTNH